jgi:hypothetical protein
MRMRDHPVAWQRFAVREVNAKHNAEQARFLPAMSMR